ncbi:MAG TPA: MFS transporter [Gaiellaceae bacterium]|nr:MFS transporter [Gaiellaceae bacterium]
MRDDMDRRAIATLSAGHGGVDFASGAIPALIPFLVAEFHLDYVAAGALMLAVTASSSLVQPLFGLWSDRRGALWLLPSGLALAAVGTALVALSPVYATALVFTFAAGIGIAAYHPEGAKFAAYASTARRASGMSLFNVGGNMGYALGPILVTPLVLWLGLRGGALAAVPALVVSVALARALPRLAGLRPSGGSQAAPSGETRAGAMTVLAGVIALRSVAWFALLTFVPLWVVSQGGSEGEGNRELSAMLVAGVVGTLALGPIADRVGLRRTLLVTQAALPPLILVFLEVGGIAGTLALMGVGFCVVGTFGITIVLSQMYLPNRTGMASGLAVGLAMGIGGVAAVALGGLADSVDLEAALVTAALAPAVGVLLCLFLPSPHRRVAAEPLAA